MKIQIPTTAIIPRMKNECIAALARRIAARRMKLAKKMQKIPAMKSLMDVEARMA